MWSSAIWSIEPGAKAKALALGRGEGGAAQETESEAQRCCGGHTARADGSGGANRARAHSRAQVKRREVCDTRTERENAANRCCRSMTVLNTNIFEVGTTPVRPKPDEN